MEQMTINYPDGTNLKALLLSRGNDTLRAIAPGDDDVRTFSRMNGAWFSEDWKRVHFEFAWQGREHAHVPDETACVCSKDLASRLKSALRGEGDHWIETRTVSVFCF
jgi:hypothetical protein